MNRSRKLAVGLSFLLGLLILVAAGAASYRALLRFGDNSAQVVHTQAVLAQLRGTAADLGEAESQERGYLLTGDATRLPRLRVASESLHGRIRQINALTLDNPGQLALIARIGEAIDARLASFQEGVALRDAEGLAASVTWVREGRGQQLSDEITNGIELAESAEVRRLNQRREAAALQGTVAEATVLLGGIISIGMFGIAFVLLTRENAARRISEGLVQSKNKELELRNREVERANQLKSEFLSSMSHELRTPLNAILGFSELMLDGTGGILTEKQSRWVGHISKAGKHLLQLISDILDLAKIEAGHVDLTLEAFGVETALPEVMSNVRPLAMAKRIRLEVDGDPDVYIIADRLRFKQVLYNLLSNAIKFTPQGGAVRVSVEGGPERAVITVADTGVGIRPEDLDTIFEEFRQVGGTTGGVREGTGLGLAIARRHVEQQGGTIRVESTVGVGSRFIFTLPCAKVALTGAAQPVGVEKPDSSHLLVLIVDDEPETGELLAGYLNPSGYATATSHSGTEAVARARALQPDCITLDILTLHGSGWETLFELRQHPDTRDIPVIVVSVVDQKKLGATLGASDYLMKPVARNELLSAVQTHVRRTSGVSCHCIAADDDPESLRLLVEVLSEAGCTVEAVRDGRGVLDAAKIRKPDLFILDLMMPELDGFGVLASIERDDELRDIPVVVLTAKNLTGEETELLKRVARDTLRKGHDWQSALHSNLRQISRKKRVVGAA
jgi:signal transduction histidine kinase/CheY-like chemotaxis protein